MTNAHVIAALVAFSPLFIESSCRPFCGCPSTPVPAGGLGSKRSFGEEYLFSYMPKQHLLVEP